MRNQNCVLVAEDDPNDVFFLRRAFKEAAIELPLQIARDGEEAIQYLAGVMRDRERLAPCLILLDLKMPQKTGMEVLAWLREQPILKCVPAIVFSSSGHQRDIELAYSLGANAFVVKPSSTEGRIAFARMIKSFWLDLNQPPMVATDGFQAAQELHNTAGFNHG